MKLRMAMRICGFLIVVSGLAISANIRALAESPTPTTGKSISELVANLDHESYAVRDAAGRKLAGMGSSVVAPLTKIALSGSLEASARAIAVLEHIYTNPNSSTKTTEEVESALEKLRDSKLAHASGRAEQVWARHADLRNKRAVKTIESLGGIVRYYEAGGVQLGGLPQQALPSGAERQISYILLGDQWKGGDRAVRYLKRVSGLQNLYIAQNKKFQPITDKAREELEKSIPNLSIQLRGLACLGVRGSPTNINGTGCTVSSVDKGSAADLGKVKAYDQISQFAGKPVEDFQALVKLIANHSPGEKVELEVLRRENGLQRKLTLTVELQGWKK